MHLRMLLKHIISYGIFGKHEVLRKAWFFFYNGIPDEQSHSDI